ncbi:MAG: hypothetical protein IH900_05395 [Proteobacteria bacterium]|nr:hypothetical protein [Pseudomonadota bacterium]
MAADVPHRYATRSWPKALGNRLYGSLSALLGMSLGRMNLPGPPLLIITDRHQARVPLAALAGAALSTVSIYRRLLGGNDQDSPSSEDS